tara:strand:+ start:1098 stop:1736 length:639 start_codon:yes stop_codon:yes gene_type:complete
MSSIKLKHSGGNSVSLNPPTSAPTSSEVSFKLPNEDGSANQIMKTDGSGNLGWATDQGGKLLQLKHNVKNNGTSLNSVTTPSEISSDFRTTITPTSGSSLIIITAVLFVSMPSEQNIGFRLYKSSSTNMSSPSFVQTPSTINSSQDGNLNVIAGTRLNASAVVKVVELASNTNQRTYSPFWCITGGTAYLNSYSGGGYFGTSTITVEEVDIS